MGPYDSGERVAEKDTGGILADTMAAGFSLPPSTLQVAEVQGTTTPAESQKG